MSTLDPDTLRWLLGELVGLLIVAAFFNATEAALTALNRNRIKQLAEAGQADAERVLRLLKQADRIAGLGLIANALVLVLFTQGATAIALNAFAYEASLPLNLLIASVLVVLGAVLPRTLAGARPGALGGILRATAAATHLAEPPSHRLAHRPASSAAAGLVGRAGGARARPLESLSLIHI